MMVMGSCVEFKQLVSGHWAGYRAEGKIVVSLEAYDQGVAPDRFRHEPCREATLAETLEFSRLFAILGDNTVVITDSDGFFRLAKDAVNEPFAPNHPLFAHRGQLARLRRLRREDLHETVKVL